jgi:hypothetical protein
MTYPAMAGIDIEINSIVKKNEMPVTVDSPGEARTMSMSLNKVQRGWLETTRYHGGFYQKPRAYK